MLPGDKYRVLAAKMDAKAREEHNPTLKAELAHMAAAYRRLSEQADRNASLNVSYATPEPKPQMQQQQQPQAKSKKD